MMKNLFQEWENDIIKYCDENGLDFNKARKLSKCWGMNFLALQYHDPNKGQKGLLDETPMPVVLIVRKNFGSGKLEFEQTQYTKEYLV